MPSQQVGLARTDRDVALEHGGSGGGGARVTRFGLDVLARFDAIRERVDRALEPELSRFAELLR